jgi:hypothetical protein
MTTYYVDGAVGNDGNTGLAEGAGNAWATIQKAADTMTAGNGSAPFDRTYVKASTTYSEDVVLKANAGVGNTGRGIAFVGYTTTPNDNGKVTITPTTNGFYGLTAGSGNHIHNFIIDGATGTSIEFNSLNYVRIYNCEIINGVGTNALRMNGISCALVDTIVAYNTTTTTLSINNSTSLIYGCTVHSNTASSAEISSAGTMQYSIFYNSLGTNTVSAYIGCAYHNVFDGSLDTVATAIYMGGAGCVAFNNIITDYNSGIWTATPAVVTIDYNLTHNVTVPIDCTYHNVDANHDYGIGAHNVVGDPLFVDKANHDYRLGSGSPALNAGLGHV